MNETVTIVGNIGSIPEQRQLPTGGQVTGFTLVSTERRRDKKTGGWVDGHSNWYDVSVFRALGENAFASLRKGQRVIVVGRLRLRSWETESSRGTSAEIEADSVGHDLLWGTSLFRKRESAPRATAQTTGESGSAPTAESTGRDAAPAAAQGVTDPLAGWGAPAASAERDAVETPF